MVTLIRSEATLTDMLAVIIPFTALSSFAESRSLVFQSSQFDLGFFYVNTRKELGKKARKFYFEYISHHLRTRFHFNVN